MLNRVKSTEYSRATTVVYTQEYPITRSMIQICQMLRLNAPCLPIHIIIIIIIIYLFIYLLLFFFLGGGGVWDKTIV